MSLIFGSEQMELEFYGDLHPEARLVVVEADAAMLHQFGKRGSDGVLAGPSTRVTEVGRTDADSERIYTDVAKRLLAAAGDSSRLSVIDRQQFDQIAILSPMGVRNWAQMRASWHKPFCGVDLGLGHYTPEQVSFLREWVRERCIPIQDWEVITEPHGTGPHIHLARRDRVWLAEFPGGLRRSLGRQEQA